MPRSLTQEVHLCFAPRSIHLLPLVPSLCLRRVEVKCEKLSRWQPGTGSQGPTGLELLTTTCIGVCTVLSDLGQVNVPSGSLTFPSSGDTSPLESLVIGLSCGQQRQDWKLGPTLSQFGAAFLPTGLSFHISPGCSAP